MNRNSSDSLRKVKAKLISDSTFIPDVGSAVNTVNTVNTVNKEKLLRSEILPSWKTA